MVKIRNYTEEQIKYLQDNYYNKTIKDIQNKIGKKPGSVSYVLSRLGLKKQEHRPWTEEENQYLIDNYVQKTSEEISKVLSRTVDSINTQRDRLGLVRHAAWTKDDISFLTNHYLDMTHAEIGQVLNKTAQAINAKCSDLGLCKKEQPWEQWELDFLKNNYMDMTKAEIAEVLNRSENAIGLKASRMGYKKSPYHCDYHYFDNIDTEEKAYWLGFLITDGWISCDEEANSGVVGLELQYGDIGHLKKLNKCLKGNYRITDRWRKCPISNNQKPNHMCVLRIYSITMYRALINLGLSSDKTYSVGFPDIPHKLMRHFIRGLFDGDGGFCLTNQSFNIDITTVSDRLCKDFMDYTKSIGIHFYDYSYISSYGTLTHRPTLNQVSDKMKFLDYIYQDSNIYLDRKYKRYLKAKERFS